MKEHKVPTKDDLLEFMKKHGPERVDSITDKDSVIKHFRTSSKLYKQQCDQYKRERDSLIDDIAVLKANISRLERENDELNEIFNYQENKKKEYREKIEKINRENRDYRIANGNLADYGHEWKNEFVKSENKTNVYKTLLTQFSQHIGSNPSSSTYKKFRKQLDDIGIRESE